MYGFAQVVDDYSSNSFRLLAMAMGTIQNASELNLAHMTPQQVEASATNMRLLSLIVLTNNVRPDSKETIAHLQDGYACTLCFHPITAVTSANMVQSSHCTSFRVLHIFCYVFWYSGDVLTLLQPTTMTRAHCCRPTATQLLTAQPMVSYNICKPLVMTNVHATVGACTHAVAVADLHVGA